MGLPELVAPTSFDWGRVVPPPALVGYSTSV